MTLHRQVLALERSAALAEHDEKREERVVDGEEAVVAESVDDASTYGEGRVG
jgi:hypothetical protein